MGMFFHFKYYLKHKVIWVIAGRFLNANPSHGHEEESGKGGPGAISGQHGGHGFLL